MQQKGLGDNSALVYRPMISLIQVNGITHMLRASQGPKCFVELRSKCLTVNERHICLKVL